MSTAIPADTSANSESESLDSLDYDDWEGQFEFIGNANNGNSTSHTSNSPKENRNSGSGADDAEDLNLSTSHHTMANGNAAILIDEMTFLTVPSDSDNICLTSEPVGHQSPSSGYFIENALTNFESVPFSGKQLIKENNDISNLVNNNYNNNNNNVNVKHNNNDNDNDNNNHLTNHHHQPSIDDVINMKNKLNYLTDQRNMIGNNNCKINGFSADLCDNLTEQVSKTH